MSDIRIPRRFKDPGEREILAEHFRSERDRKIQCIATLDQEAHALSILIDGVYATPTDTDPVSQ